MLLLRRLQEIPDSAECIPHNLHGMNGPGPVKGCSIPFFDRKVILFSIRIRKDKVVVCFHGVCFGGLSNASLLRFWWLFLFVRHPEIFPWIPGMLLPYSVFHIYGIPADFLCGWHFVIPEIRKFFQDLIGQSQVIFLTDVFDQVCFNGVNRIFNLFLNSLGNGPLFSIHEILTYDFQSSCSSLSIFSSRIRQCCQASIRLK